MNPICNLSQPFPDAGERFTHKSSFLRLLHVKDNRGSPGFHRYRNHILHLKIIFNPSHVWRNCHLGRGLDIGGSLELAGGAKVVKRPTLLTRKFLSGGAHLQK